MDIHIGTGTGSARVGASFLNGGLTARYLSSASVARFPMNRAGYVRATGTQGVDCSINPHIPACRPPTDGCTFAGCGPAPTGPFCPTGNFVQTCGSTCNGTC